MKFIFLMSCLFISLIFYQKGYCQEVFSEDYTGIASVIQMDSFVFTAVKEGFKVEEFIEIIQEDSSFAQAFQNLRKLNYLANNEMEFFDKKGNRKAAYQSKSQQYSDGQCRSMQVLSEEVQGDFYKKNKTYTYLTAKMYDKVFFTKDTVCQSEQELDRNAKGIQKYYNELKQFIFQPGERVEVPLVANKTAIFEEKMIQFYDYTIGLDQYKDGTPAYTFTIEVKPKFLEKRKGKTLLKYMKTYFDKEGFQVLGRNYQITYKGVASCDVEMQVELGKIGETYFPQKVVYQGFWNIPGKKKEIGRFTAEMYDFKFSN